MATLSLQNITKSFGIAQVLQGIDLAIRDKEFVNKKLVRTGHFDAPV